MSLSSEEEGVSLLKWERGEKKSAGCKKILFVGQSSAIVCKCRGVQNSQKTCQAPDPAVSCSGSQKMKDDMWNEFVQCLCDGNPSWREALSRAEDSGRETQLHTSLLEWLTQVLMWNNKPGYWVIIKHKEFLNPRIVHILKEINHCELWRIQFYNKRKNSIVHNRVFKC